MANTLTALMGKILSRGLPVLRERCMMPQLVNGDYSKDAVGWGATINVPIPSAVSTTAVVPGKDPITPSNRTPLTTPINLDQWQQNEPIHLTDKDRREINSDAYFLPMSMQEAIRKLASDVNVQIYSKYYMSGMYFKNGTKMWNDTKDATKTRALLNKVLALRSARAGVLDFDSEAQALELPAFQDTDKVGGEKLTKFEGEIGRKFGIDWVADDEVPVHVTTALGAGVMTLNGAHALGATSISIAKGAGANWTAKKGDIIHIAGENTGFGYSIQANVTVTQGANTTVSILPGLRVARSGSESITRPFGDSNTSETNCLIFQRDAIGFATRSLADDDMDNELGNKILTMQDKVSKLVMRLEVSRQHKQNVWEFDIYWGSSWVRPEHVIRVMSWGY